MPAALPPAVNAFALGPVAAPVRLPLLTAAMLLAALLSGCAEDAPATPRSPGGGATGAIVGVAVDESVRPLANVLVSLDTGAQQRTGEDGMFRFDGLEPRGYVLSGSKPGHKDALMPVVVVAGPDPPTITLRLDRIPGQDPYHVTYKMDGFYECGFAALVISDTCDMAVRTVYDELNSSGTPPPTPRQVQANTNTQYIDIGPGAVSVIQEGFWDDPNVQTFIVYLSSTPIDNACDCSERDYLARTGTSPTYGRLDKPEDGNGSFPVGQTVAARGFLDYDSPGTAHNFRFTILTTVFYHHRPAEGWTFATQADHPL